MLMLAVLSLVFSILVAAHYSSAILVGAGKVKPSNARIMTETAKAVGALVLGYVLAGVW